MNTASGNGFVWARRAVLRALGLSLAVGAAQLFAAPMDAYYYGAAALGPRFLQLASGAFVWVLVVVLAVEIFEALLPPGAQAAGRWPRLWLGWAGASAAGLLAGAVLPALRQLGRGDLSLSHPHPYVVQFVCMLALAVLIMREFEGRTQARRRALADTGRERAQLDSDLAQARHDLLRAQIEPHFLFNSLANLRRLAKTDTAAARAMLGDLLRYLEEALPRLRESQSTLGSELELARAYIAVHQVRMGPRLSVTVTAPEALLSLPVPPMSVLTLVENAIKHGLQPKVPGGCIAITAALHAGLLQIDVADDGVGMGSTSGHGTGLANLRARLRAEYGSAASLSLRLNDPQGVVARLQLPSVAP